MVDPNAPGAQREVTETDAVLGGASNLGNVGAIAVDGDEAFVTRYGDAGAVLRIGLGDHRVTALWEGALPLGSTSFDLSVAVDATHVYWLRHNSGASSDVLKRARCGGATVIVMKDIQSASQLVLLGSTLVVHRQNAIVAIAK